MSLFKCKMCGADLEINESASIAECEYCGTKQTVPKAMDENLQNLFNRANTLRIKSEFDKAEKLYEKIIQSDSTQSEAYWGLILCKYGIEYVDDPVTFKKVPTCHRASYDSIIADDDYKSAIENADMSQRMIYEEQAKEIDRIQKEILALAQKEESYDVFICYKETDASGSRTQDSVIANDIYYQLTNEGFKVFYAAITLEGKLGSAYEPIIFAALNSAKVMLAIGTKPEYFNAVWVKNEWSRYLKIIKNDRSKLLIPCYRDMDAYELPDEFAHLQAQDMAKIGFINDVVRGIQKVIAKDEPKPTVVKETVVTSGNTNTAPLLRRAFMFLEDGEWNNAVEYCEKVLDIEPECAEAYLGKLMADLHVRVKTDLANCKQPFDNNKEYSKVIRFADDALKNELVGYVDYIKYRNENARLDGIYQRALIAVNNAKSEQDFKAAAKEFQSISKYKDAANLADKCRENAEIARKDAILESAKESMSYRGINRYEEAIEKLETIKGFREANQLIAECYEKIEILKAEIEENRKARTYNNALSYMSRNTISGYKEAIGSFETITGYRDADELLNACHNKIEELKIQAEAERVEKERKAEIERIEKEKREKKNIIIASIVMTLVLLIIVLACTFTEFIIPANKYNEAVALMDAGNVIEAFDALIALDRYKDSADKAKSIYDKYKDEKLKLAKAGDYMFFGAYEQDNNISNGKEYVEWLVLEVKDGKALVISKYALDCKQYNTKDSNYINWDNCTLRTWLNNDFINTAFSADEKAMIPTVTVSVDENPSFDTYQGEATQDQVFLLSITEANRYFSSDSARQCKPTDYAVAGGAYVDSDNGNCWWWLRSSGINQSQAAGVSTACFVSERGYDVDSSYGTVRPAMWITLPD